MRIIGLYFDSKNVGVAISDPRLAIASGMGVIERKEENKLRQTLAKIEELIVEYDVQEIVLGFSKNMAVSEGEYAELAMEFKEKLERRTGLPVYLWDAKTATVTVDEAKTENRVAAMLILQGYLDRLAKQKKEQ